MNRLKAKKARVGLYSVGLKHYWGQFEGLRERLEGYGEFIKDGMSEFGDIEFFGLVDDAKSAREAGEWFQSKNVDIIFCHCATYITSDCVLPVHQQCTAPVIVLNLQPSLHVNYEKTTTGEWLAHCVACPVPEIANAFNRAGIEYRIINGLLGLKEAPAISVANESTSKRKEAIRAWNEIREYILAAGVKRSLKDARFGFLGNTYSGMLDLYTDFTEFQARTGAHIQILEMCDLDKHLASVTDAQIQEVLEQIREFFIISEDSISDPLAKKPTEEQLRWAATVAVAQRRMVEEFDLDAIAYYYHAADNNPYEKLQSGTTVGHSFLTANGIPCAGEGDLKTALAMKICDLLETGGSYCEIVTADYSKGTILMGHDGPFHMDIASEKPVLRGMGLYHGKKGHGVAVEAKVRTGPITTLAVTETLEDGLKLIVSEGTATNGKTMQIGNTQTHVKFDCEPDEYYDRWFMEAPQHHLAISVGHNASLFKKVADLLDINIVEI